jgi:subtilase family serine protease
MELSPALLTNTALFFISLVLFTAKVPAQTVPVRARVTDPVDTQNLVTLRGNVHPLARAEYDQGPAPDDLPMERMLLVLRRGADQETALRQLLDEQQVKSSPLFHQWLTPEQFGQQFGPADSDIQAVTDWLAGQGFQVKRVATGRTVIEFSGSAGLVRQVLGTEIHRFRVNGEDHWANTSDPQIPAALAPVVAGIDSLNNFPRKPLTRQLGTFSRSKLTGEVHPLFTFPYSGSTYYALGATDFATIYNVAPLWTAGTDGTGQAIAVAGETNINLQDVADFRAMFGLPAKAPNIILNGPDPGITSTDEPEADLDVQWSGAVAKGATIDLVVSESTETTAGIDLSALYIIDNNLAPVMSESYGSCEASLGVGGNQFYSTLWEQAAAQGITVLMAAGDSGSAGCDYSPESAAQYGLAVSGLASTPFNVAVGGTDFNDLSTAATYWNQSNSSPFQNSAKSYIPESTWNDSCASPGTLTSCSPPPNIQNFSAGVDLVAGAGGASNCASPIGTFPEVTCSGGGYAKPSWQSGPGVPSDGLRDVPDLSLFSGDGLNDSFYVMCEMDANASQGGSSASCDLNSPYLDFQGTGGTSASVQTFAGIMALVNQAHGRQGNANYVLYALAARAGNTCVSNAAAVSKTSCVFYDTTTGNNSVICQGGTPNCSNTSTAANQYGIMASGNPLSAAYTTTPGYDLATGLGSVNAANLVNNWTSNFTPSTTTLSLSTSPATNPITLTHGHPINFTIDVTSGSGTPAGDVSIIAQTGSSPSNATGIGAFTLSGGSISGSTSMLPGGTYNVTAHYAGNGTFAASDSTPGIPVTVNKEGSQTEIRLVTFNPVSGAPSYGATTAAYGSPYVLRMDVTNSSGQPCANQVTGLIAYPCPTGALTVSPAPTDESPPPGTIPGHYTLNSQGYAEDQPIQQTPGRYPFVASYAGDNSYTGSTSPSVPITITQTPTTTSISGVPSSGLVGTPINVTSTLTTESNGIAPTGTMQLLNNGSPMSSSVTVSGTASSPTTGAYATAQAVLTASLPVGNLSITARYSGDGNYATSTSPAATVSVSDFSLSANPSPVTIPAPGQAGNSTISVAPQNGFTGTVNLSVASGCPTGATCTLSPTSVIVSSASAVTSTLTITTTAPTSAPPARQRRVPPSFRLVGFFWLLAGLLALAIVFSSSALRRRPASLLFATALLVVGVWVACGGGGGGGSPPPPTPTLAVSLSPARLTFSSQNTGTTSPAQSVTLSDTGSASLTISSITVGGSNPGDFAQTNTCGSGVAAGGNCTINVTFKPTATGSRSASLSISDNASGSPQALTLSGTGNQAATPPGAYSVTVQATMGNLSHTLSVPTTVQ